METLRDYNNAIEKFCKDNTDSTIYLVGEVSHPGISDLDFLIVDNKPVIDKEVAPYLMGGNVLIVPEFAIKNIQMIENFNLKLINGTGTGFSGKKAYNENEKIVEILEWLPERILKCKSLSKTKTNKRNILLLHKSINRSIQSVSELTGKNYNQITTEIARSDNNLKTSEILRMSIDSGILAWNDFEIFLLETKMKGMAQGSVSISDHYMFENTFNHLLLYFYRACMIDCQLSAKLSNRLSISVDLLDIDNDLDDYIVRRWKKIDEIYAWFVENKLKTGMIKYGWLL
jgi:hypothetical protein